MVAVDWKICAIAVGIIVLLTILLIRLYPTLHRIELAVEGLSSAAAEVAGEGWGGWSGRSGVEVVGGEEGAAAGTIPESRYGPRRCS